MPVSVCYLGNVTDSIVAFSVLCKQNRYSSSPLIHEISEEIAFSVNCFKFVEGKVKIKKRGHCTLLVF